MANWPDTDDSFDDISAHGRSWNASSTDALPTESLAAEPAGNTASSAKKPGKHARCLMKLEKDLNKMREKLAEKAESMAVQQMQTEMFHNFQQLTLSAKGDQRFVMLLVLVNTLVVALGIAFGVWMQTVPSGRCDADLANMQDSLGRFQLAAARCEDFETRLFKVEASAGVLDNYYLPPPMCDGITPEEPGTQPSAVLLATIGCVGSVVVLLILTIQLRLQHLVAGKADLADVFTKQQLQEQMKLEARREMDEQMTHIRTMYSNTRIDEMMVGKVNAADVFTKEQLQEQLELKANCTDVFSRQEMNAQMARKANCADTYTRHEINEHMARQATLAGTYSRQEVDELLAGKAAADDTYARQHIDEQMAGKACRVETYTRQQVDGKLAAKASVADTYTRQQIDAQMGHKASLNDTLTRRQIAQQVSDITYTRQVIDGKLQNKAVLQDIYTRQQIDEAISCNVHMKAAFDPAWSGQFYSLSQLGRRATFKQESTALIPFPNDFEDTDKNFALFIYQSWPAVRVLSSEATSVTFKIVTNDWAFFGLGAKDLKAEGFPGYSELAFMICSDGSSFYRTTRMENNKWQVTDIVDREVTMNYDRLEGLLTVHVGTSAYAYHLPSSFTPSHFVFAIRGGTIDLLDVC
eukprot:TRINITY_DN22945_c0_g1_i1.p1 TRINITY_DN22945_c0_g1~~TRINITY_DN22945_c0_g1_i1.p1  ORF type:complete len:676 (-),score=108.05 TRINITY_DN22945_c0_g1_i1:465-2378(-)